MSRNIYRCHYRGHLKSNYDQEELNLALDKCKNTIRNLISNETLMTAALYYHENMLFLYYECIGDDISPTLFMEPIHTFLETWPTTSGLTFWANMYHIYYHAIPDGEDDWKRPIEPSFRRGRIAYLKEENMFQYIYHHTAIVNEGLLAGDKYQSIALHDTILFSYFEEPKTTINIRRDLSKESSTIKDWIDAIPENHFAPIIPSQGGNFLILPSYFALGQ